MFERVARSLTAAGVRYVFNKNPSLFPNDVTASLFHRLYYHKTDTWMENRFLGVRVQQSPFDLYLYAELLYRLRPDFIVQTGVAEGGSALFLATLLDIVGARIDACYIGVDISLSASARAIKHRRVRLIEGDSTSPDVLSRVRALADTAGGMVILDSNHTRAHVLQEIRSYKDFVRMGSYLVVEDTNINSHGVCQGFGPGPREAVEEFLAESDEFVADNELWQRNLISFHEGGWLRRVR